MFLRCTGSVAPIIYMVAEAVGQWRPTQLGFSSCAMWRTRIGTDREPLG
jgi:hypothetical protein